MFLLFLLYIFDKKEKLKERVAAVKAFKQNNQDTTCITSIDDTVKFVYGHLKAFMEFFCITDQRI